MIKTAPSSRRSLSPNWWLLVVLISILSAPLHGEETTSEDSEKARPNQLDLGEFDTPYFRFYLGRVVSKGVFKDPLGTEHSRFRETSIGKLSADGKTFTQKLKRDDGDQSTCVWKRAEDGTFVGEYEAESGFLATFHLTETEGGLFAHCLLEDGTCKTVGTYQDDNTLAFTNTYVFDSSVLLMDSIARKITKKKKRK